MKQKKAMLKFPKRFLWGATISAYQTEGGNENDWSSWELETAQSKAAQAPYQLEQHGQWATIKKDASNPKNYVCGQAVHHLKNYEHDFDIAKTLHLQALVVGIEWSRLQPTPDTFDKTALAHYKRYLLALKKRGVIPIVTLWDHTLPEWFAARGGFGKRRNGRYFIKYAQYVAEQLGAHMQYVLTMNMPATVARSSYLDSAYPPEHESRMRYIWTLYSLIAAHAKSYRVMKKIRPALSIGVSHEYEYFYAGDDSRISQFASWWQKKWRNHFFMNRVKNSQDFIGLQFYTAQRLCGTRIHNPVTQKDDHEQDIQPEKLYNTLLEVHDRYHMPILITGSGLADHRDELRYDWLKTNIVSMSAAMQDGVKLLGYMHRSLLDGFEWEYGYWPRWGLIEINRLTQQRIPRTSARWYGRFIKKIGEV